MFSFTKKKETPEQKEARKKKEAKRAAQPLTKKDRKEGKMLLRGVKKFLHYNDDLIDDDRKPIIDEKRNAFCNGLEAREQTRGEMENLAEDLTKTCKKSVKKYKPSAMKENMEVIFVAVVIAMGIRAYFIQQFKIPTGSMQPTMNGIIAYPDKKINPRAEYNAPDGYERPAIPKRLWDQFWYGRSHVEWISGEDDALLFDKDHFYDRNPFLLFPRTYLITKNGQKFSAPGTYSRIATLLNTQLDSGAKMKKGQIIAKGFVDTGDQLVVDKFTYHWRKPKRGEVFVFHTRDIEGIQKRILSDERKKGTVSRFATEPPQGSQHYIKRLVGVPGDKLEVQPPLLKINGEVAREFGMKRVMSMEGRYPGYTSGQPGDQLQVNLGEKEYWAMGDNSANSADSRSWGVVPRRNIVGRAFIVYYPFGHHFGKIK